MRFGLYFDITLNRKMAIFMHKHNNYSYMHMLGGSGAYASSPENNLKIWCSLVRFGAFWCMF